MFIKVSKTKCLFIRGTIRIRPNTLNPLFRTALSGTDQPECSACHCPLTVNWVKHILIECPALTSTLNKHFTASSMKDLFDNVAARNIINFIKESHFIALYNVVTTYFILA